MHRPTLTVLLFLWICSAGFAQQVPCKIDVPVTVILPDGSLIEKLGADGFVARTNQTAVPVESLTADAGPRRIVFVVENGKRVADATRRIEAAVISDILANARDIDSFALLTTNGPRHEFMFGSSRDTIESGLKDLHQQAREKTRPYEVLEAVLQAVQWFQQPQPGDAIMLLALGTESDRKTSFPKVQAALASARIRLYGFHLGERIAGYVDGSLLFGPRGMISNSGGITPNHEDLFTLSTDSAGFAVAENTLGEPWHEYKLSDPRTRKVTDLAWQMYKAITQCYRIQFEGPVNHLDLDLSDTIRKQLPEARVLYPKQLGGCAPKT